jgi:hypothetical protein
VVGDDEGEAGKEGIALEAGAEIPIGGMEDIVNLCARATGGGDGATGHGGHGIGAGGGHGDGDDGTGHGGSVIEAMSQFSTVNSFNWMLNWLKFLSQTIRQMLSKFGEAYSH